MVEVQAKPMQLDPEFRQRWLDALRSDEWAGKETYHSLTDREGNFCAIGLAAHVSGLDPDLGAYGWLDEVQGVSPEDIYQPFDGMRMTFAQFADWLEANSEPRA